MLRTHRQRWTPPWLRTAFVVLVALAAGCKGGFPGGGAETGEPAGEAAPPTIEAAPGDEDGPTIQADAPVRAGGAATGSPGTASDGATEGVGADGVEVAQRRNDRLAAAVALPFYPGASPVPSLSREAPGDVRVVLTSDEPCDRVVRFYEQRTGQLAQMTELTDGNIYDIVIEADVEGAPILGVQVRQTPRDLADRLSGRTSVILFRRKP